jgi:hypothetical protein
MGFAPGTHAAKRPIDGGRLTSVFVRPCALNHASSSDVVPA